MKREPTDTELARLLSGRSGPSVLEKEAAFEAVMQQQPKGRRFAWRAVLWPAIAVAAVGLGVLVMPGAPDRPEFGTKGSSQAGLSLSCVHAQAPVPCAPGATLTLKVTAHDRPYFAAFAQDAEGTIIWYLPAKGEASERQEGLLEQGFVLDPSYDTSTMQVFGVFTDAPMSRAQIKAALSEGLKSTDTVTVLPRTLTLQRGTQR